MISLETGTGIYANTEIPAWKPAVISNICDLPRREKIYKILASHPERLPEQIVIDLPDSVYSTVADKKLRQYMNRSATKWEGIRQMLRAFGIDAARAVFFGDDNDDVEPILKCGCGVALDSVKDSADHVTLSNDEDGAAVFLDELLKRTGL